MKKIIYFCLSLLLLAWLVLPFGARAVNYGSISLTEGSASAPQQITRGTEYGFSLNVSDFNNGSTVNFKNDNITSITVIGLLNSTTPETIIPIVSSTSPSDAVQKLNSSQAVIIPYTDSITTTIQIYASINYIDATTLQPGLPFSTPPVSYSVAPLPDLGSGTSTLPPVDNGTGNATGTATGTINSTPTTTDQATSTTLFSGDIATYITGGTTCNASNVVTCYIGRIIRLFILIASIGSIFMIIMGGIYLITSAGDPKKVSKGRLAVTGAIIGLVIVLLSLSIMNFVQNVLSGGVSSGSNTSTTSTTNGQTASTPLPNLNSLSNTLTVTSNGSSVIYTKVSTGNQASSPNDNGLACTSATTITINGSSILCGDIRNVFNNQSNPTGPYPDANFYGEQNGSGGKTYYQEGINVDLSSGDVNYYYKTTANTVPYYYDTWSVQSSSANPYNNVVTNPSNPNNNIDLLPTINSVNPTSGIPGASVTIAGANFGTTYPATVTFNGVGATITSQSDATIVAVVPDNATSGDIIVTTPSGSSNTVSFTVTPIINNGSGNYSLPDTTNPFSPLE